MSNLKNRFRRFLDEKKAKKAFRPKNIGLYTGKKDAGSKLRTKLRDDYLKSKGVKLPEKSVMEIFKNEKSLKKFRKEDEVLLEKKRKKLRNK